MHRSRDPDDERSLQLICGALFFGVPGQGMEIKTLKSMVQGTPHEYTLNLLDENLGFQLRSNEQEDFSDAFKYDDSEIVQFFERKKSKTVIKVKQPNSEIRTFLNLT